MMEIHIDSVNHASYDQWAEKLTLNFGSNITLVITDRAMTEMREALPGNDRDRDLSDLESAIGELRSRLEDAQGEINSALEDAESSMADAQGKIEDARNAADCHGEAAEALNALESAFNEVNS
jgi:hypothetical protein